MCGILLEQERAQFIPELALFTQSRPDRLQPIIGDHIIYIQLDMMPAQYAYNVVRYCELSAWVEDPALILRLLDFWSGKEPFVSEIINRIKSEPRLFFHPNKRPFETCLLALSLPFINRSITRNAIELFLNPLVPTIKPAGAGVLIVNGGPKSGKTFTHKYINYVSSIFAEQKFKVVYIDYKSHLVSRFGPAELTASLVSKINPQWANLGSNALPVLDAQQPARWGLELAKFVADAARNTGIKWLIILDHFNDPDVPRETIELIQVIAEVAMASKYPEASDTVKLVLLDFNAPVPNFMNRLRVEEISDVDKNDIVLYFERFAEFKKKTIEPEAVQALVDLVFSKDPGNIPGRTEILAKQALSVANEYI
jgi:hypothetical protein